MKLLENLYTLFKVGKEKFPYAQEKKDIPNKEDIYADVENLLCFERAARFCYASIEMMVHNRTIRQQCQNFSKWSRSTEAELERILGDAPSAHDLKASKGYQPYTLPPDDVTMESILSLGLVVAEHRLNAYQDLRKQVSLKHRILVNQIIAHVMEEIKFFKREKDINSVESVLNSID